MGKFILGILLFLTVLFSVFSDIISRKNDGVPDPRKTGIETFPLQSGITLGAASVDLTPFVSMDYPAADPQLEAEKGVNPLLNLLAMPHNRKRNNKRKIVNKLYLKAVVFCRKDRRAVIFSAELPRLTQDHLNAVYDTLKAAYHIGKERVLLFSSGLVNIVPVSPPDLARCAARCVAGALKNLSAAEYGLVTLKSPGTPSNFSRVPVPDAGAMDVPPLCGPLVSNKTYDATDCANHWLSTMLPDSLFFRPLSIQTKEDTVSSLSLVLFRSRQKRFIAGLVLSPVQPFITPPGAMEGDISSDYIYYLCSYLEKKMGGTWAFIRSPGTDIVPFVDNFSHPNAHRFGTKMASNILSAVKTAEWHKLKRARFYYMPVQLPQKAWASLADTALDRLAAKYREQSLALRSVSLDLPMKREVQDKFLTAHYLKKHYTRFGRNPETALKAVRLNDFLLLALPGAHFFETQRCLSRAFPDLKMDVADNLDGYVSYVVPESSFNGGFKPNRSIFSKKAFGRLTDRAADLIRNIKPLKSPN